MSVQFKVVLGEGSVMEWDIITVHELIPLPIVDGNLTGESYRDTIVEQHVISFINVSQRTSMRSHTLHV